MIPLRDENPTRSVAVVTIVLIALNAAAFLYELSLPTQRSLNAFFADFALIPAAITQTPGVEAYRSVLTSMFLHGGWLHLIFNMLFLWIFGNNIEDSVGHFKFVIFYLLCGIAAAAAQVATQPDSLVPMIGASGAVSGVLGAYLLLFPRARVLTLIPIWIFIRLVYLPAWLLLIVWFALQLLSGAATVGRQTGGGVAFWAHIGGFVAGMILIPVFKKRRVRLFQ
jgi:membrane associated rhomboid family serine protease